MPREYPVFRSLGHNCVVVVGPKGTLKEGKAAVRKRSGEILAPYLKAPLSWPGRSAAWEYSHFSYKPPLEKPTEQSYEEDGYLPAGDWPEQFIDPDFGPIG